MGSKGTQPHKRLGIQEPGVTKFHAAPIPIEVRSTSPKPKDFIGLSPEMLIKSAGPLLYTLQMHPSTRQSAHSQPAASISTPPGLTPKVDTSGVQDRGQGQGDVFSRLGNKEAQVIVGAPQFLWLHLPSPNPASSATCCTLTQSSLPLRASGACCWNCPAVHGPDA